jgi:DNA modification methylase
MAEEKYEQMDIFELKKPVIKGYPELRWTGKRPYTSTQFFPAQLKERYGEPDENGWINKIYWGDNLQVMSHLLRDYRGKIDLIYIDPPFDSKADYKKKIKLKGKGEILNDNNVFEEKQYGDIWTNDEYLQFMYERLVLLKELLSDRGTIYLHCDWHKSHHLRCLMDEVFGPDKFINEIAWCYKSGGAGDGTYAKKHDTILFYAKTEDFYFKTLKEKSYMGLDYSTGNKNVKLYDDHDGNGPYTLVNVKDWWSNIGMLATSAHEREGYPTQKPEGLLELIMDASCPEGGIVFDCFMGSGTTQAVAMKKGIKFIGADINLGSVQITTKRLLKIRKEKGILEDKSSFDVYNVNNYDFFRNPIEAKDLLIEALNIQPFGQSSVFDGELDGRNVKILPVNRIATKADLGELVANLPYKTYEKRKEESPNDPVDRITLVCMGHEPDLKAGFEQMVGTFRIDVEIVDILRDKSALEFKREATAKVELKHDDLIIKEFYPMNLLQKLSIQKENVDEWRQLVDSIMIDYNYNGETLNPQIIDIPEKNDLVKGRYNIPKNHGRIKVKITDLLSESLEVEVK